MNEYLLMLVFLIIGYFMGILSMIAGACLMSKVTKNRGLFPEILEPKGEVFNVETPDDLAPFPDDEPNKAEEHILAKTNRFLERLGA